MDWNPGFEQELQQIHKGHANQQQHEPEYGYHAQQSQAQQQYSSLSESHLGLKYGSTVPLGQRLAAALSYVFAWITGFIFFLFAEKRNRFVRFHAMQSLLFLGGVSILGAVVGTFLSFATYTMSFNNPFYIDFIQSIILTVAWVALVLLILTFIVGWFIGIISALRGRYYKMPFVGDFVERYINRQAIPK